jgi:hypothetical protein
MKLHYDPWPPQGCTLAEARERTADRQRWQELAQRVHGLKSLGPIRQGWTLDEREWAALERRDRDRLKRALREVETEINTKFRALLHSKQLIAYGRQRDLNADTSLIEADKWPSLPNTNWKTSAVGENRKGGAYYLAVRVYPIVKSPNVVDLLSGLSFVEAFRQFIVNDPEIQSLGKEAIKLEPEYERVFIDGKCYPYGADEWGVKWHEGVEISPEHRSLFGILNPPPPRDGRRAYAALADRFGAFLALLRNGHLNARGLPQMPNLPDVVPRTVWSHHDFHFDANAGDLFKINPECEDPPRDLFLRCWIGLLLEFGTRASPSIGNRRDAHIPLHPHRKRRSDKSDAVLAAAAKAGIDLATCGLAPKAIASEIRTYLPFDVSSEQEDEAHRKMIGRLQRKARSGD